MKKLLRPVLLSALALLFSVSVGHAQSPHPGLAFTKEQNSEGSTDYLLKPVLSEMIKRVGGPDKPYQIIGAVVRPAKHAAVLLFVNAQTEFQFHVQSDTSVFITADAAEIRDLKYNLAAKSEGESEVIKTEIANVLINWKDFQTIAKANSVTVKYGSVIYHLDTGNIDALHYLLAEIEKGQNK